MLVSMNSFLRVNANFWPVHILSVIAKKDNIVLNCN